MLKRIKSNAMNFLGFQVIDCMSPGIMSFWNYFPSMYSHSVHVFLASFGIIFFVTLACHTKSF